MKLTSCLLKIIPYRYRGKYRIVKDPKFKDLLKLRHDLEREERNMLILRHPYLTSEQSYGHMKGLKKNNLIEKIREERIAKFSKHVTIAERLNHFRVNESWE